MDTIFDLSPWFAFFVLLSATAGIHRIWHWEQIFAPIRQRLHHPLWTPLICPSCSPIWIGFFVVFVALFIPWIWLLPFAFYPFLWWLKTAYGLVLTPQDQIRKTISQLLAPTNSSSSCCEQK